MQTFLECFNLILTGNKEKSRQAARRVRKLLYGPGKSKDDFKTISSIVENAPREYKKISEEWRQENFVVAISVLYFLHNKKDQFDFLFPWLYGLIQHPNGNIRYAVVRMFENDLGPLTAHIRIPEIRANYSKNPKYKKADDILFGLFVNLLNLAHDLEKPSYQKYKYISSIPSGSYKSVQMVLASLSELCGEDYMEQMEYYYKRSILF